MGGRGLANKKPTAWVEEGGRRKKNKRHPDYFFHVGCGAPIYEKVRGLKAERAHLPFVAEWSEVRLSTT